MKSAMCSHDEHEVCGKVLTTPSGKHFRCDCECHPKEVKRSFEYEDMKMMTNSKIRNCSECVTVVSTVLAMVPFLRVWIKGR